MKAIITVELDYPEQIYDLYETKELRLYDDKGEFFIWEGGFEIKPVPQRKCEARAILVIDKPESCFMCPFRQKVSPDDIKCWAKDEIFEESFRSIQTRINCPLKPLPETKDVGYPNEDYDVGFGDGWDRCIDEILGEQDE